MTARRPRFEIVRTDAAQPWHARYRAANGRIVWTTETYARRDGAVNALRSLVVPLDSRVTAVGVRTIHDAVPPVEVRDVDERVAP